MFEPVGTRSVRWRPLEGEGFEHLTLRETDHGIVAESVVTGDRGDGPYGVRYRVDCDALWRVRRFSIESISGQRLAMTGDGDGHWRDADDRPRVEFDGCIDIDLQGSPFTNTLPIRRAGLTERSGPTAFTMLYVPFDSFSPFPDGQRYTCLEDGRRYRYEAVDDSFEAELTVDRYGLVVDYPPLFQRL